MSMSGSAIAAGEAAALRSEAGAGPGGTPVTEGEDGFVYAFEGAAAQAVSIVHDDSGAVLSDTGERAWSWRQWDGGKVLARYLERSCGSEINGQVVLELGAGTGLVSLVAARLGAAGVAATDLAHGMDLLKHNAVRNLPLADEAEPEPEPAAGSPSGAACCCCCCCCPEGHALGSRAAECEDYICNVCDSDIDEGGMLWSCAEEQCEGFDLCGNCEGQARVGEWGSLPTWFKVQAQAHQARGGTVAKAAGKTTASAAHTIPYAREPAVPEAQLDDEQGEFDDASSDEEGDGSKQPDDAGVLLVEELDWSDEGGVARMFNSLAKAGLSRPRLVLGADLSYDRDTIVLLVATISRIRSASGGAGSTPPVAMLLVHDKRSPATTAFLLEELATAGLEHELEDHASAAEAFGLPPGRMMLLRIALC